MPIPESFGPMGAGRGHRRILRQHQPRMAAKERSYGYTDASAVAKGWSHPQGAVTRNGRGYATRGNYLPGVGESGTGWSGNTPQATPRSDKGEEAEGECGAIRGRLCDYRHLPGGSGKRGETLGRAVPRYAGPAAVAQENTYRPHRRRLRLPWMEFPEIRRNVADQTE
ncbi:hypothetical protein D3C84_694210 [compost metagenome]